MSEIKSDIQIAREAKMQPIKDILSKIDVPDENFAFSPMGRHIACLLYTSPSPRDISGSRMPSSA